MYIDTKIILKGSSKNLKKIKYYLSFDENKKNVLEWSDCLIFNYYFIYIILEKLHKIIQFFKNKFEEIKLPYLNSF